MADHSLSANARTKNIKRAFVSTGSQSVHYRVCGSGPAIVMLHDSPRSSRLHISTMLELSDTFKVYALDTPGYGNSPPLDIEQPTIRDFADALDQALGALGLQEAPLYATHTSAKIALDYVARYNSSSRLVLDGLSIPVSPAPESFINAYMRPFKKDDDGAFIAREWSRVRDMLRWFPWFAPDASKRMPLSVAPEWIRDYTIDLFAAGPHYSDAYSAAMRYDPKPALLSVKVPTIVGAKSDDVLFESLQRVPVDANAKLAIAPLSTSRSEWLDWLIGELGNGASIMPSSQTPSNVSAQDHVYVETTGGQIYARQYGDTSAPKLLILDTPLLVQGQKWADALKLDCRVLLPDLPGFGESDPLESVLPDNFARALNALVSSLCDEPVAVLATSYAAPLAALFAQKYPHRVSKLILDGGATPDAFPAASNLNDLIPYFEFGYAGTHLHETWHMIRDSQTNWPWHDQNLKSHRKIAQDLTVSSLYDSFMGVLKQPEHYGDALRASFGAAADIPVLPLPTLFLYLKDDPAYAGTEQFSERWPHARIANRTAAISDAALAVLEFLKSGAAGGSPTTSLKADA
jgi:pimeloyl-ACP methyl ester carboxylesterase